MKKQEICMPVIHPHAAGIDVGSKSHWVAVDQETQHVKEFGVYTKDHWLLIEHLRVHHITTVAMESTGSYWQTLFNALQKAGFHVLLCKGGNTKNVSGKKTDMLDCIWIQRLHSMGLLPASFILSDYLQTLRTYYNHREFFIQQSTKYINKMQKAMRLMNIRLDVTLNDITGKSGRAIIEAILSGSRDPHYLASLADYRVKKSKVEIAEALQGEWRDELLFELASCLRLYDVCAAEINQCDQQIEALFKAYQPAPEVAVESLPEINTKNSPRKTKSKFSPCFNVHQMAFIHFNTDLFQIPGVSHSVVLSLLCNMGNDIKRFSSAKQFACWLRLVPNNKVSGGKVISSRTPRGKNPIGNSLRQAANTIGTQQNHPLAPFFRRIAFKKGRASAITATARKLAIIIWNMITKAEAYRGFDYAIISRQRKGAQIKNIGRRIAQMDLSEDEVKMLCQRANISWQT